MKEWSGSWSRPGRFVDYWVNAGRSGVEDEVGGNDVDVIFEGLSGSRLAVSYSQAALLAGDGVFWLGSSKSDSG